MFLAPDGACDMRKHGDDRRDVTVIRPPTGGVEAPLRAGAHDPGRRGNRLARRCQRRHPSTGLVGRLAAALAVAALTAALLAITLAQPDQLPTRTGEGARPATVAPVTIEPLDILRRRGVPEAAKPRQTATPRPRSRPKPATRPGARRSAPRRTQTRARPAPPAPAAAPVGSPSPSPAPSLTPVPSPAPRAPTLPAPVPPDAPPEFM